MNDIIGNRIREMRVSRQISQEQMAERLKTTRQRFARLESGQLDVSYVMIKEIADLFGVSVKEITNVDHQQKALATLFRDAYPGDELTGSVEIIERILKTFSAHEKLYKQMKACGENEA